MSSILQTLSGNVTSRQQKKMKTSFHITKEYLYIKEVQIKKNFNNMNFY